MSHPGPRPPFLPVHPVRGATRRAALQAGTVGLLGLGMNHLAGLRALAAPGPTRSGRAKSVIYIFLSGGLAQHETFDMKPDAPLEIRGDFKPMRTSVPGIHISEHLPELAKRAHKWALVRSLTHSSNDHSASHHIMLTGRSELPLGFDPNKPKSTDWPSITSIAGASLPKRNNLPPAVALPDKLIHRTGRTIPGQFAGLMGRQHDPWFLEMSPYHPAHYGAYPDFLFHHEKGQLADPSLVFQAPHLSLPQGLTLDRVLSRVSLRDSLEQQTRYLDQAAEVESFDSYRQAALSLLANDKVHETFDLSRVDPKWLDRYGRNSFGWSLLMARRLVEAGVSLVQVNLGNNESWDNHQAIFPNLKNFLLPPMDRAVSALIDDLDAGGLLDETLIVMGSEFGRTPKISTLKGALLPGRDHWGAAQTILLAGGGVKGGNVIGATDSTGGHPVSDAQTPENMAATIYEALGIPRQLMWHDFQDRPFNVYQGEPIRGLM